MPCCFRDHKVQYDSAPFPFIHLHSLLVLMLRANLRNLIKSGKLNKQVLFTRKGGILMTCYSVTKHIICNLESSDCTSVALSQEYISINPYWRLVSRAHPILFGALCQFAFSIINYLNLIQEDFSFLQTHITAPLMRCDLFTPQQFPLSHCLKGSEMSLGKEGQAQVTPERKHTRFCVTANKARQLCRVQHEPQEMDF